MCACSCFEGRNRQPKCGSDGAMGIVAVVMWY